MEYIHIYITTWKDFQQNLHIFGYFIIGCRPISMFKIPENKILAYQVWKMQSYLAVWIKYESFGYFSNIKEYSWLFEIDLARFSRYFIFNHTVTWYLCPTNTLFTRLMMAHIFFLFMEWFKVHFKQSHIIWGFVNTK